jgi:transcriptional regulator with XRE-family HTH domain
VTIRLTNAPRWLLYVDDRFVWGITKMPRNEIDPTDRYVGSRVRMRRMLLRMSQEKVGDALGVTFQQQQKYEKGINRISASRLQHLSQILRVPISFFFDGAPESTKDVTDVVPDYVTNLLAMREGVELVRAFSRIPNRETRRAIVDLVEQIVPE